jgi:hypothetical protein
MPHGVESRWVRGRFVAGAKLSAIVTAGMIQTGYACQVGYMAVSPDPVTFSCQKMNEVTAQPVPILSNEACPSGSEEVDAAGAMDPCQKTIHGRTEIVLRLGDRCPPNYRRLRDSDGYEACRLPTWRDPGAATAKGAD